MLTYERSAEVRMEKTEIMKRFVHQAVQNALTNSRLPYNHAIGELLESEAEIVGSTACVRVIDEHGNWILLEDRIKDLKNDPRFRESIPAPAKVTRSDELAT